MRMELLDRRLCVGDYVVTTDADEGVLFIAVITGFNQYGPITTSTFIEHDRTAWFMLLDPNDVPDVIKEELNEKSQQS